MIINTRYSYHLLMDKANNQDRDGFRLNIKELVAKRAAYLCSNPGCRKNTIGPNSDPLKALSIGVAAHICAASPGGPRYDDSQSTSQRSGLDNAIWLCVECSTIIDKDPKRYTKENLLLWKREHESELLKNERVIKLPNINLRTEKGLSVGGDVFQVITAEHIKTFRESVIEICNENKIGLKDIELAVYFPELIVGRKLSSCPAGSKIIHEPIRTKWFSHVGEGGSITFPDMNNKPFSELRIGIDVLLPSNKVEFQLLSVYDVMYDSKMGEMISDNNSLKELSFHITGHFQYEMNGIYIKRRIIVPINYNKQERSMSASIVEDDIDQYKVMVKIGL